MGLTKYILSIWILINDDLFLSKYFKSIPLLHIGVTIALAFSFMETGFITGKQMQRKIYPTIFDFIISRLVRLYIPGLLIVFLSLLLMSNSLFYIKQDKNLFSVIGALSLWDKLVYGLSHISLLLNPWMFYEFDESSNSFTYKLGTNSDFSPMLGTSIAPHLWTIMPDVLGILFIGYFMYSKKFIFGVYCMSALLLLQAIIIHEIISNNLDILWIWQNPICLVLFMSSGFIYGYTSGNDTRLGMNKYQSIFAAWGIIALFIYLGVTSLGSESLAIVVYLLTIPVFAIACHLLWPMFAFKKWDMRIRNMNSHLYFWHVLLLSLIYHRVEPSIYTSILSVASIIIFSIFFGPWFEGYNKKLILYLQKKRKEHLHEKIQDRH